jgi:hypothetical protein
LQKKRNRFKLRVVKMGGKYKLLRFSRSFLRSL